MINMIIDPSDSTKKTAIFAHNFIPLPTFQSNKLTKLRSVLQNFIYIHILSATAGVI